MPKRVKHILNWFEWVRGTCRKVIWYFWKELVSLKGVEVEASDIKRAGACFSDSGVKWLKEQPQLQV